MDKRLDVEVCPRGNPLEGAEARLVPPAATHGNLWQPIQSSCSLVRSSPREPEPLKNPLSALGTIGHDHLKCSHQHGMFLQLCTFQNVLISSDVLENMAIGKHRLNFPNTSSNR